MKKILMSAAVLALALASCQNEEVVSQADGMVSVKAVMGINSRTTVDEGGEVTWSKGDKMLVYGGETEGVLTLEGDGGSENGVFTGFVQGSVSELTTALYPAEMASSDGTITLSQVTYPNSNSPMVAEWSAGTMQFSHLAGMVRLTVNGLTDNSTVILEGEGIGGTAKLNGNALEVTRAASTVVVSGISANAGYVDIPVFATADNVQKTLKIKVNGVEYSETVTATLKKGALSLSELPILYYDAGNKKLTSIEKWDGATTTQPDEKDGVVLISCASELAYLAENIATYNSRNNLKVVLTADIDLGNEEWTSIAAWNAESKMTFDGGNHTIYNLRGSNGLFANVDKSNYTTVNVENLRIVNAQIISSDSYVGVVAGNHYGTAKNITIENAKMIADDSKNCIRYGALFGQHHSGNIENCSADKVTISGVYHNAGGLVGTQLDNAAEYKNCTVTNSDISIRCTTGQGVSMVGAICGNANGVTLTLNGCSQENTIPTVLVGKGNVIIDGTTAMVSTAEEITVAVNNGVTNLILADGEYDIEGCAGKTFTIQGSEDAVIKVVGGEQNEAGGQLDYGLDGSTVTFNGVTIRTNNNTYAGYARLNATYIKCIFDQCYCLNGSSIFDGCTFNVSGNQYNVWTWGAPTAEFTGCIFNCDGKAMLLYGAADTKLTMNSCTFNDNGGLTDLKAAIEIGNDYGKSYELIVNNATVNGFEINDKGINTGTTLWANKNSMGKDKLNVVIDGVDVY